MQVIANERVDALVGVGDPAGKLLDASARDRQTIGEK